jgi:hypothetical protein
LVAELARRARLDLEGKLVGGVHGLPFFHPRHFVDGSSRAGAIRENEL